MMSHKNEIEFSLSFYEGDPNADLIEAELAKQSCAVKRGRESIERYAAGQEPAWATTLATFLGLPIATLIIERLLDMFSSKTPPPMIKFTIGKNGSSFVFRDAETLQKSAPDILLFMQEQFRIQEIEALDPTVNTVNLIEQEIDRDIAKE